MGGSSDIFVNRNDNMNSSYLHNEYEIKIITVVSANKIKLKQKLSSEHKCHKCFVDVTVSTIGRN